MNPWILLALGAAWIGSVGGAYMHGRSTGEDKCNAMEAIRKQAVEETREAAQQGAASEIAKIKPKNVTIKQETEREIRTNTVYADCKLPAAGVRLANEAITGIKPEPAGAGKLPGAGAAIGRHDGGAPVQGGGAGQPIP